MTVSYIGSGPYCYANCLAMMLGGHAPTPSQLEVLTGSPFGMQLLSAELPLFDPYGWDPDIGIDAALRLLGWRCTRTGGGDAESAMIRLREAVAHGAVMVGPVEMGLLRHQPGMTSPIGADHWVVVIEVTDDLVVMHDPHGHPYATLPITDFAEAWRAERIAWIDQPFVMRTDFHRVTDVNVADALRESLPAAASWLANEYSGVVPSGTLGTAAALNRLASMLEQGIDNGLRAHLVHFAVRVGARRLNDATVALADIGLHRPASIASEQSRTLGSLQWSLVSRDDRAAATTVRRLSPTYDALLDVIEDSVTRESTG
ncbi:hypothetical protein FB566_0197 [Stackebrandtia endophytica]|uniref:Butirosin biosynthesis protein H-like n=1 Tax=Stackebrandtia endophytica TaxID=1496996 RepID=A0A543AQ36_9ACTN|nr:hypothetical protein [Stackebrandtia endophytica]TQL74711.1 hypothetical protein FB566_0197 [Stackebrandtia endophytica]